MIRQQATTITLIAVLFILGCKDDSIPKATMDEGKKIYDAHCLGCHMEDAMGVPSLNPPLKGSELLLADKMKPIRIILKGSEELKDRPDKEYKNIMATLSNLTDKEIADVLTFTRNSFGNKALKITEAVLKAEREKIK